LLTPGFTRKSKNIFLKLFSAGICIIVYIMIMNHASSIYEEKVWVYINIIIPNSFFKIFKGGIQT